MNEFDTIIIDAECKLVPGSHFVITRRPDETTIFQIDWYRDASTAYASTLPGSHGEGLLGEDFQAQLNTEQLLALSVRVAQIEQAREDLAFAKRRALLAQAESEVAVFS